MEDQVPAEVVKERYERLHRHQEAIALGVNQRAIGREFELLVTESESDREGIRRMSGKSEDARLVHFTAPHQDSAEEIVRPGDFVTVEITEAKPFYLIASDVKRIRPSRGGDAFAARKDEAERSGTLLGMPKLSRATLTAALG
jgi:tRNA-2-methylthio-N6-dimethylallyladenosine synthase